MVMFEKNKKCRLDPESRYLTTAGKLEIILKSEGEKNLVFTLMPFPLCVS